MASQERQFFGSIKSVQVKGELRTNSDGDVISEPEIILTLSMDTRAEHIRGMSFLAAAKIHGAVVATIESSQSIMDLGDVTAAVGRVVDSIGEMGGGSVTANGRTVKIPAKKPKAKARR